MFCARDFFVVKYSNNVKCLKPWSNGPASCRKWTQVELAKRLKLGGQTDSQVSSQVHASRKNIIEGELSSILLANISLMDVTRLKLTWLDGQTARNVLRLACKFDLDQSERKSSQVHASARKPWQNGVASRPKF